MHWEEALMQILQPNPALLKLELVFQWWNVLYSIMNVDLEVQVALRFLTTATDAAVVLHIVVVLHPPW